MNTLRMFLARFPSSEQKHKSCSLQEKQRSQAPILRKMILVVVQVVDVDKVTLGMVVEEEDKEVIETLLVL